MIFLLPLGGTFSIQWKLFQTLIVHKRNLLHKLLNKFFVTFVTKKKKQSCEIMLYKVQLWIPKKSITT